MRAFRVLAALLALTATLAAIDGCKKRETKPAPQVAGATEPLLSYNLREWGPVAQRLVQGTHLKMVPSRGNA